MNEGLYKATHEKNALQRYFARRFLFDSFQRLGFHVTGDHFYEVIPNTRQVAGDYSDTPRDLRGIDFRLPECESRALQLIQRFGEEYLEASRRHGFREKNHYFRGLDAFFLYLVLRDLKPRKVVEVGQGFSTCISFSALESNARETGQDVEFISIDPYARLASEQIPPGVTFRCLHQELQSVDIQPVLTGCGFLFVDSSHVYKFGSDVECELTRIYPALSPQTGIHMQDVLSPYDYPLEWMVKEKRFWNEQYLIESFLMFNSAFEVYLPLNLLTRQSPRVVQATKGLSLEATFRYTGQSFYIRRGS